MTASENRRATAHMTSSLDTPSSSALIAAAGQGLRLGLGHKAFLELGGRPLVEIVASKLLGVTDEVLVAAPPAERQRTARLLPGEVRVIEGDHSRQGTLMRLLDEASGDLLLFHFVARPFATQELFRAVLTAAQEHGAASACLDPGVPVGIEDKHRLMLPESLSTQRVLQTPRAFRRDRIIIPKGFDLDESRLDVGTPPETPLVAVPGEETNIKITSALDWEIARRVVGPRLGLC